MHPLSIELAEAFERDFWSADREITWLAVEEERQLYLSSNTLLIGRIDARGITSDSEPFFGEWKSLNPNRARYMNEVKMQWRTSPQALTYGVLCEKLANRFCVRWVIKSSPPRTDFEWYTYTQAELDHWKRQVLQIAGEIRNYRAAGIVPWRTNFTNCFRYGVKYACPFFADGCSKLDFSRVHGDNRIPHLDFEREYRQLHPDEDSSLVVLDATRISDYLLCPESYRKKWEGLGYQETNEALTVGGDFHDQVAERLGKLIK